MTSNPDQIPPSTFSTRDKSYDLIRVILDLLREELCVAITLLLKDAMRQMLSIRERLESSWYYLADLCKSVGSTLNIHFSSHDISGFCADISNRMVYKYWPCRGGKQPNKSPWSWDILSNLGFLGLGLTIWKATPIVFIQTSPITNSSLSRLVVRMSFAVAIQTNHGLVFGWPETAPKTEISYG